MFAYHCSFMWRDVLFCPRMVDRRWMSHFPEAMWDQIWAQAGLLQGPVDKKKNKAGKFPGSVGSTSELDPITGISWWTLQAPLIDLGGSGHWLIPEVVQWLRLTNRFATLALAFFGITILREGPKRKFFARKEGNQNSCWSSCEQEEGLWIIDWQGNSIYIQSWYARVIDLHLIKEIKSRTSRVPWG